MFGRALIMPRDSESIVSKVSALLAPLCTAPLYFLLRGSPGRRLAAWVLTTSLVLSVQIFWEKRRLLSFWMTVAIMTALHVLLVLYVPWPEVHTTIGGPAFVPFGVLDVGIFFGCFKLVEKVVGRA